MQNLEEHTKMCMGDEEVCFKCKQCDKRYRAKKELQIHRQTKHKVFNFGLYITQFCLDILIYISRTTQKLNIY